MIAEAARHEVVCEYYSNSNIVAQLLEHAKKDKSALQVPLQKKKKERNRKTKKRERERERERERKEKEKRKRKRKKREIEREQFRSAGTQRSFAADWTV